MRVETLVLIFTNVLNIRKLSNRVWPALRARLAYAMAAFNLCTTCNGEGEMELAPSALSPYPNIG